MKRAEVPKALQERLGDDATEAFVYVLNSHQMQMANDILARIDARTDRLERWLDVRFGEMATRFGEIDRRFGEIDQRFGEIDQRFEGLDQRFERLEQRSEQLDQRSELRAARLEGRLDAFSATRETRLDAFDAKQAGFAEALERGFGTLRADMADQRAELLKWMFLFWVGQAFAVLAYSRVLQYISDR